MLSPTRIVPLVLFFIVLGIGASILSQKESVPSPVSLDVPVPASVVPALSSDAPASNVEDVGATGTTVLPVVHTSFVVPHFSMPHLPGNDWLLPDVCVDSHDSVVSADPYYGCPQATTPRQMEPGDPQPYQRFTVDKSTTRNTFPAIDPQGRELVVNASNEQPLHGYALYINDPSLGYVSSAGTKDPVTFYGTFFGKDLSGNPIDHNGWVFYPTSIFDANDNVTIPALQEKGDLYIPTKLVRWDHLGIPWPGEVSTKFNTNILTSWKYVPKMVFAGNGSGKTKAMDTIQSIEGFTKDIASKGGHLEVFYFTKAYGLSRWESWFPEKNKASNSGCTASADSTLDANGIDSMEYQGLTFYRNNCSDYTYTDTSKGTSLLVWSVPALNFLRNFHFSNGTGITPLTYWNTSSTLSVTPKISTTKADIGVRYVSIQSSCSSSSCSEVPALSQDIPVKAVAGRLALVNDAYAYGVTARAEKGTGTLSVTLSQVDASGKVLSTNSYDAVVGEKDSVLGADTSITYSATFATSLALITILPQTTNLHFSITPKDTNVYDVVEAWVMRK
jgi:hypothetical protein